jgi:hypothetical protein
MDAIFRRIARLEEQQKIQEFSETHDVIVRHFISTIQEDRNFENLKRATLELDLTSLTAYFNELMLNQLQLIMLET